MKRLAAALVLVTVVGLAPTTSFASSGGDIEGTVVDMGTGQPIAGAITVDLACGAVHQRARVDGSGHFAFSGLPDGACTLTASGAGYIGAASAVTVASGAIKTLLVRVETHAYAEQQRKEQEELARRYREMPMPAAAAPSPPAHRTAPRMPSEPPPPPPRPVHLDPISGACPHRFANRVAYVAPPIPAVLQQDADGWAAVRVFPVPQYTKAYDGPRTDFRETLYWNPAVETNAAGDADVSFPASDAVTSFRATAEGWTQAGTPGRGEATFQAKLPLTLDAHLPVEVTSGDAIRLPVTLANDTDEPIDAELLAQFGPAFRVALNAPGGTIHLAAHGKVTVDFPLEVIGGDGSAAVHLAATAHGLSDEVTKSIRVVPRGFPIEASASGTATSGKPAHDVLDLAGAMPGSIHASVTMYPSPVAMMTKGMEAMIREPGGCFEQTSATNYPNIMILSYLQSGGTPDAALVGRTQSVLDKGYKLLTGFETPEKGYEWFGRSPGHEALTAYGLMEFADMGKVFDVDHAMVERTAAWLMARRDHHGGFLRSHEALDSFGRASDETTTAYIMWALAEAKRTSGMTEELAAQTKLGAATTDPYLLALAANTALLTAPTAPATADMVTRLARMQGKDGSFAGAQQTITMSGGESVGIETTSLAMLALVKAAATDHAYEAQLRAGADWLNHKRDGFGDWSNTQATILGLKALAAYTEHTRAMAAAGTATLVINGAPAGTVAFDKGRRDAIVWDDVADKLHAGANTVELRLTGGATLPYSIAVTYRSARPASAPATKVAVTTRLLATHAAMGDGVTLRTHVENTTQSGIPMTLARIGLPGGTVFQTWQLTELRDKGLIDYFETRPREVIVYWRSLAPGAKQDFDIKLLAAVPGTYEAPASSAYLYYTAEDKAWAPPVTLQIDH